MSHMIHEFTVPRLVATFLLVIMDSIRHFILVRICPIGFMNLQFLGCCCFSSSYNGYHTAFYSSKNLSHMIHEFTVARLVATFLPAIMDIIHHFILVRICPIWFMNLQFLGCCCFTPSYNGYHTTFYSSKNLSHMIHEFTVPRLLLLFS